MKKAIAAVGLLLLASSLAFAQTKPPTALTPVTVSPPPQDSHVIAANTAWQQFSTSLQSVMLVKDWQTIQPQMQQLIMAVSQLQQDRIEEQSATKPKVMVPLTSVPVPASPHSAAVQHSPSSTHR